MSVKPIFLVVQVLSFQEYLIPINFKWFVSVEKGAWLNNDLSFIFYFYFCIYTCVTQNIVNLYCPLNFSKYSLFHQFIVSFFHMFQNIRIYIKLINVDFTTQIIWRQEDQLALMQNFGYILQSCIFLVLIDLLFFYIYRAMVNIGLTISI